MTPDKTMPMEEGGEPPPERIGPYRILDTLGEGGMGTVYIAEQKEPVRRRVALKVIKLGMDSKEVLLRFEAERQALAMMEHDNIAKVFDAGTTERGQPYFAMEHVPGLPLTEYCDKHKLSNKERMRLFQRICAGVQHAHQKGVIHRDLKPSNILVAEHQGRGVPKIIDFGVAKATDHRLTAATLFTAQGYIIGTPEYMSPEQAEMTSADIDTRTDVYSLGIILYELMVGELPFPAEELRKAGLLEIQRKIREDEPPKPSTRITGLGVDSKQRAQQRSTTVASLMRELRGDLDWIVMRALEKERNRRYATATALAEDIDRHLKHEPVVAGPPSAGYRLRKLVRRYRGQVVAGMLVFFSLVAGIVLFALENARANREARSAVSARDNEAEQRKLAEQRADELEVVAGFQASQLSGVEPEVMGATLRRGVLTQARNAMEREGLEAAEIDERQGQLEELLGEANFTNVALDTLETEIFGRALAAIDERFADQPLVMARLLEALAGTLGDLGLLESAMAPQERALSIRRSALGDDHRHTLKSINNVGVLLNDLGRLEEAEPYYREALETSRRVLGDDDAETLTTISNMGILLRAQGKLEEAEPYYREALEGSRRVLGNDHAFTLRAINNMGFLLKVQGKPDEAEPYYREALEGKRRVLGDDDPSTLTSMSNLGVLLSEQGKLQEAERYHRQALEGKRRVQGDDHPSTLTSVNNLGALIADQGNLEEAEPYYREALEGSRRVLGDDHASTLISFDNLGKLLQAQGKLAEAEPYYRQALDGRRRALGDDHAETLASMNDVGFLLKAQGKLDEAEPYYRQALDGKRRVLGDDDPSTLTSINNMGALLKAQGKLDEAETYHREALDGKRRVLGDDDPSTLTSINNMGALLKAQGKLDEAEPYYREALEGSRRVLGDDHPDTLTSIYNLGGLLQDQGKLDEAESYYREAILGSESRFGGEDWRVADARLGLGRVLTLLGRLPAAETELIEAERVLGVARGVPAGAHRESIEALVALYEARDKAEPGNAYDAKAAEWRAKL